MAQVTKKYNYCMDFLKGLACIFVVFIHVKFPGDFGQAVQAVARFAVPFFFMVSGYYCYRKDYQGVAKGVKKIWHIAKITICAYLFYIVVALLDNKLLGGTNEFDFSLGQIIHVAIFSVPSNVPGQLWFLIALLEIYIIYFFFDLFRVNKLKYIMAIITFISMIMLAQGAWYFEYHSAPNFYRNAWIEGFSFFTLGYFLHNQEDKIKIKNKTLIIFIVFSTILSIVERFACGRIFAVHLFTIPLVMSLFVYAIKNSESHAGKIQKIGKKYSMYVYILHMFFWTYFDRLIEFLSLQDNFLVSWLRPIMVLGLTILASMGCYVLFNCNKNQELFKKVSI